jgi:hypothetical protein
LDFQNGNVGPLGPDLGLGLGEGPRQADDRQAWGSFDQQGEDRTSFWPRINEHCSTDRQLAGSV